MNRDEGGFPDQKPRLDLQQAQSIARTSFGIEGVATPLPSERDLNFKISPFKLGDPLLDQGDFVLKISNPATTEEWNKLENQAIELVGASERFSALKLHRSTARQRAVKVLDANAAECWVRMLAFVPGSPFAEIKNPSNDLVHEVGVALGHLDLLMKPLCHSPVAKRKLKWDLIQSPDWISRGLENETDDGNRNVLNQVLENYLSIEPRLQSLEKSVIHNDANDYNIIVDEGRVCFIDFGDMVFSTTINNLAICAAYLLLGSETPLEKIQPLIAGYDSIRRIDENEMAVLFPLIAARLGQSVSISVEQQRLQPDNEYLSISRKPAWEALRRLVRIDAAEARMKFADTCLARYAKGGVTEKEFAAQDLADARIRLLAPSLSLSYDRPLHIVRGRGQYLFASNDSAYLDCVNNVCHVGHCHPEVVSAAIDQIQTLNTNTRYLHENVLLYAKKLTSTLPAGLEVCFFVNSGSEANDLALRLARNFTGNHDVAVIDHAYHGHLTSLIELSPYKFNGRAGRGKADHVHVVSAPDGYRGEFKSDDPECGKLFAGQAVAEIRSSIEAGRETTGRLAAFFAESLLGCGGQVPLPAGYLRNLYPAVRELGGVCVADEVQVGFGRVGSHFWGFEQQGVVPDIVTMGKPIGNGHPMAAVVTTREIADAFNNGMEYFNTFGGNPVSSAIGLAVLNVIEKESLQSHALAIGNVLIELLLNLKEKHPLIGDVRGSGLFLGIELVRDRGTFEPAADEAHELVQRMRARNILLSTDGPFHNVIKFKPPMVFDQANAERLVMTLDRELTHLRVAGS